MYAYSEEGSVCLYNGKRIILNHFRPFFAGKEIEYVFSHCCNQSDSSEVEIKNGDAVLEKLGFTGFEYNGS